MLWSVTLVRDFKSSQNDLQTWTFCKFYVMMYGNSCYLYDFISHLKNMFFVT